MNLTDTQLVILSAASQREDRGIELSSTLKGAAARKVVGKLLTEGLIEEIHERGSLPVWHRDEDKGPLALRITKRGLAAIRVDERGARPAAEGAREPEQRTGLVPDRPPQRVVAARRGSPGARLRNGRPNPAEGPRSRPG
jgi:hypothetical protein